jgi:hypothetical protein
MRSLPSDLTAKVKQSLQTLGNVGDPKLKIALSRAKTTVTDANYWTVETIRAKAGLGDISVAPRRSKKQYGGPDRLYEIHVEDGQVHTSIREYPDKLKQGWQPQFTLGPGSSVAIAFDGDWERYRKLWRLKTHDKPWIFWVDSTGILWGQLWDSVETKIELATGVSKVVAIRGWKEIDAGQNDQGIVVSYILTNGTAWYRNYCIQPDLTYMWEFQRQITGFTGTVVNIGLFLTNDYRLGITIENNTKQIWWLITSRTWVGMATSPENIMAGIRNSIVEIIPIKYIEDHSHEDHITTGIINSWVNIAEPIYPIPLSAHNPNKSPTEVILKFNYPLAYDLSLVASAFTIRDGASVNFSIVATQSGVDNSEIIFTVQNFNGSSGDLSVIYDRNIIELDCVHQGSRFGIGSFTLTFTPDLVPPQGYEFEYIGIRLNSTLLLSQVHYRTGYGSDNIQAGVRNSIVTVTKVGSNPL